ncbi:MAG: GNAT family N-acetyltransferase [Candidatus Microbacterium colombiense]|nr:MAG: GNAT family N-acetyltransferase [Microbacterium sp.]
MWELRPSRPGDAGWIAELRAVVLRPDLERLGRYDEVRVRQRFLDAFDVAHTHVIVVDGADAGSIALRREDDAVWVEHFYLDPAVQGHGIGTGVLARVLTAGAGEAFRLNVLQGSAARRLYERHGFRLEREDAIDVFLHRQPSPS